MDRIVKWSKNASKKFSNICSYLEGKWGEQVSKTFIRKTFDLLEILKDYPELGTIENKEKQIRGFVLVKQVSVFYRIKGNTIILLNFYDNRQNPKKKRYSSKTL